MNERPEKVQIEKVLSFKIPDTVSKVKINDVILYALGIGFSTDPLNLRDLEFTYEFNDNFRAFPSYATSVLDISIVPTIADVCEGLPQISPMNILHGIHTLDIYKPLQKEGVYYNKARIEDIQDKEKGALLTIRTDSFEDKQCSILAFTNRMHLFIRGIGGFDPEHKHKPTVNVEFPPIPKSTPTFTAEQTTAKNQALLFRLNGDFNPLHADPAMAEVGGFQAPILHGLCTYGITAKMVLDKVQNYKVESVKKIHTKFMSHVFPGETIQLKGWICKHSGACIFEATCKERNKVVAIGVVEFDKKFLPKL